ncbi:hypothetical protein Hanom_Chr06g00566801 [Helianthus anomalus]
MGEFKLRVNIARFAAENSGLRVQAESSTQAPKVNAPGEGEKEHVKSIIVPDRTEAVKRLIVTAVAGRVVDLETLVDFDRLLRIAKISYAKIQFLGGLSLLISFPDEVSSNLFRESKVIWDPWFSKLEKWNGQSLPLEKVAWLRLSGIPLHLFDPGVIVQVGELFGKVLHSPKLLEEEPDLSMTRVGVLVGKVNMINEVVPIKWKTRF